MQVDLIWIEMGILHITYGLTQQLLFFYPLDTAPKPLLNKLRSGSTALKQKFSPTVIPLAGQNGGDVYANPDFYSASFFVNDVGVVVRNIPMVMDEHGTLPEVEQLDALATNRGNQDTTFTAVGYSLQLISPVFVEAERSLMVTTPHLIQINAPGFTGDFSLLFSNNHSPSSPCFRDLGGRNFYGDSNVVAGVTSLVSTGFASNDGVFRMDRKNVLNFVIFSLI